jgi:hypothetical protein
MPCCESGVPISRGSVHQKGVAFNIGSFFLSFLARLKSKWNSICKPSHRGPKARAFQRIKKPFITGLKGWRFLGVGEKN